MYYKMFQQSKALLVLLLCIAVANGDIYQNPRMGTVTTFSTSLNTVCLMALSQRPRVAVKIELMVASEARSEIISAGAVIIRNKLLLPVRSQHKVTMQHVVEDGTVHIMKVLLDGNEMEFVQSKKYDWSDTYTFDHVAFSLKGTADIKPCENPYYATSTLPPAIPTTRMITTTTTTTTTTAAPTTAPQLTYPANPTEGENEEVAPVEESKFKILHYPERFDDGEDEDTIPPNEVDAGPESPLDIGFILNETFAEIGNSTSDSEDGHWWDFFYVFGDFKRIPFLLILIIVFCVGLGIGSVATILCDNYCCCCCCDDDKNDDDNDGDIAYHAPDFLRPSANATYVGTVDPSTGRLRKENISSPMNSGGSHSQVAADTYSSPYQVQREHYLTSSSTDETLPLNSRLTQDNQQMTNGSYGQQNKYQNSYH